MPSTKSVQTIAKILAKVPFEEEHVAKACLDSAYARMKRDKVVLDDLLELTERELYQDALVRLLDVMKADLQNLSEPAKRDWYQKQLSKIVEKFSGNYRRDSAREEDPYKNTQQNRSYTNNQTQSKKESNQQTKSPNRPFRERVMSLKIANLRLNFDMTVFQSAMAESFSEGWYFTKLVFQYPIHSLRLLMAGLLFGIAFSMMIHILIGVLLALVTSDWTIPDMINVKVKDTFSWLAAGATIYRVRSLYYLGWYRYIPI